ncbi:MAG: hypothetical protein K6F71_03275 [Ruminococcus sp.]|uniref:hypothetical protein n=1 Tax=Ruminococcus sp. TaxID=41978 RepID=UPI0025EDC449|nr:hypothetical protein [Ruminococcus sp.]MCR5539846.1 hypothetical protein [Ruminococcus sp.]
MPQINKIRIVNFSYNDGKRFIPDELYDLSSPDSGEALNTLFNLNNGGGKTVLVQLMMQPVHPRAMAGGRRIEDYFLRPGDHSFILLEWDIDDSKDKLLIGIAIAASSGNTADESQRGNYIKYYTFKTTYEGFSPYSISELELSKNENGKFVPAAFDHIREKAKTSRGELEYYSSDDSVKWAEMLSEEYGIHRTEWETVIEVLNKDEGGLNQYFEEAKTSDKLISKFFIPAIEHKLKSASSKRSDSSLETMLINYARKITDKENVIRERDTNNRLLGELSEINDMVGKLYSVNDELTASVSEAVGFKAALLKRISEINEEISSISQQIEEKNKQIADIEYEEKSKEYYIAKERFEKAESALAKINESLEKCKNDLAETRHKEDILHCAKLYDEIQKSNAAIEEIKKLVADKENNSEDAERIAALKYSVYVKAKETEKTQSDSAAELSVQIDKEKDVLKDLEAVKDKAEAAFKAAKENYNKACSDLTSAKYTTDKRLNNLGIELIRKFDDFYSADEAKAEKSERIKRQAQLNDDKEKTDFAVDRAEKRKAEIPEKKAAIQIKQSSVSNDLEKAKNELKEYDSLYEKLTAVCEKYSLSETAVFSGLLRDTIRKDMDTAQAELTAAKSKKQELEDKKTAAEKGCLHILPEIMRYVESTGVYCKTGEEYLSRLLDDGNISKEQADRILFDYPEFAYSLLFNTPKDMQRLLSAGNLEWLPAVVPLFTMEQVGNILNGSMEKSAFLSACDCTYFADKDDYVFRIDEDITRTNDRITRLTEQLRQAKTDIELADNFNYPDDWRVQQEKTISKYETELAGSAKKINELEKESERLEAELTESKDTLEAIKREIHEIDGWFRLFDEFESMLSDEENLYDRQQCTYNEVKNAEDHFKTASDKYELCKADSASLQKRLEELNKSLGRTREILTEVDGAEEASVTEGELETLYSQYNSCLENMNESLKELQKRLSSARETLREAKEELSTYSCDEEEYKTVSYSPEQLRKVKEENDRLNKEKEACQSEYNSRNNELGSAEKGYNIAKESLAEYDGIPLSKDKIGGNFRERKIAAKEETKILNDKNNDLEKEKQSLERLSYKSENLLGDHNTDIVISDVVLSDDPEEQWGSISAHLSKCGKEYSDKQKELNNKLIDTISEYKDSALAEIIAKLYSVRTMVINTELKGDRLFTVSESIGAMIASIEKINSKIETDLREIENDFNDIVDQCFIQGKRMYTDLRMIAASSKAHIFEGKPQTQMVKLDLPEEKEISEEASRVSIQKEIEQGANELKELLKIGADDKQVLKRAKIIVGSERLLHKYIRKESISVKVYKIDLNSVNSSYKKWEDTLTQSSGAEKFVVFFSVVLTLMNYTRSSSGLVSKNAKSVLILDNPFGKITSAHLLRPMFDIAKHFNVQLICLSDINKSDVISCFDCVIKLVIKIHTLSDHEILTHEGNERIEHGYYKIINRQLSLF